MNKLLTLFPDPISTVVESKIPNDNIFDLLESVMPYSWQRHMVLQGFDPMDGTIADLVELCERMEATEEAPKTKSEKSRATKDSKKWDK